MTVLGKGSKERIVQVPLDVVQNMSHASLDTTTGYTTSEERRRMKTAQAA